MKNVILTILAVFCFSTAAIASDLTIVSNDVSVTNTSSSGSAIGIGGVCVTYAGNTHSNNALPADFKGRISAIGLTTSEIKTVCYDGDGNFEFILKNGHSIRSEEAVYRTNPLPRSEWFCKKL